MTRKDDTQKPKAAKTVELRDARALRAVAHPLRLSLLGLLRVEGPLTATQAARRLGTTPQLCTFHLNQLAKYGLVEDAGGGHGRERPWRTTALATSWSNVASSPDMAAASEVLESVLAQQYFKLMQAWVGRRSQESREWQEAAQFGDKLLYLTADELAQLGEKIDELTRAYGPRTERRELRPADSRLVAFLQLAFPRPPRLAEDEPSTSAADAEEEV